MQLPYSVRVWGERALGSVPVPILSGPNRGCKWSLATLGRGYGSGRFAPNRLRALEAVVREGDCFWDIGAHKGYVTLAASRMVGRIGEVVALEPSVTNLDFLRRHVAWNRLDNVRVVTAAVSDHSGKASFGGRGSSIAFRLGVGPETVRVATVEGLVEELGLRPPTVMKLDVEGEEAAVLRGAARFLGGELALLISTHGRSLYEECRELLARRGFTIYDSWEIAQRRQNQRPWASDHDMLALGPTRARSEPQIRGLRLIAGPGSG